MKTIIRLLALALFLPAVTIHAAVGESSASALKITQVRHVASPPAKAWAAFLDVAKWWSGEHTYSGNAANLHLDARPGGCWCETLPDGGGVLHMTVVNVMPDQRMTLSGGLGPLQTAGVAGAMTFQVTAKENGSEIALTYNVGGYYPGGLNSVAGGVDEVLTLQFDRLTKLIDTGNAEEKPAK